MRPREVTVLKRVLIAICLIATVSLAAQQRAPQNESIRQEDLRADLFFLAGDAMRGRLTDTVENRATGDYIRSRFERLGLKPAGAGNSYFQNYNLMTATLGEGNALAVTGGGGGARRYRHGQEFYPQRFGASGQVTAPVVFTGFGIGAPRWRHDDYNGDVKGKIVLVLDHEPGERDPDSPFEGVVTAEPAAAWRKALAAQEKGAAAILFVSDIHNHPGTANFEQTARNVWPEARPHLRTFTLAAWADRIHIPAAQISPALAASLVAGTGKTLAELGKAAEAARGFTPLPLPGVEIELTTAVDRHTIPDRNVVALLEGSDPKLKDEWVIVSAHFDHNGDQVFAGADDNGSGTVALLEIADAYALAAQQGRRPRRSILFAAWNSEERGLLGAWAYTEEPLAPLTTIAAVLNMDMIGRNEEVQVGGGARFNGFEVQSAESNSNTLNVMGFARTPDLSAAIDKANAGISLELKRRYDNNLSNLVRRSDQWPFLQRGVPALGFMTGLHPDYHTVYDRPEKINYVKMEKIARLIHQASWDLANADSRPKPVAP
ncbi:MAG: M28 family peptidase [Vicinamibacterales bacterium]|jgi:Zn-dependent M28 family amino/carboxypeptidase